MNDTYIDYIDQLLDHAKRNDIFFLTSSEFNEFEVEVREAMDKQEPLKPIPSLSITPNELGEGWKKNEEYTCSICERVVVESDEYCWHCGQKLDWEE